MNARAGLPFVWMLAFAAGVGLSRPGDCSTGSLWRPGSRSLIADRRAARPGDILTILVVERSATSHQAAHETEKKLSASGGPGGGMLALFPEVSVKGERTTSGTGSASQSTSLVDRISAVVTAVTPQGNLQVQAVRRVRLNKDELVLTISGLVRPEDITAENSVLSAQVADCRMEWSGHGPIPEKQRPGLLSRLLSLLW
jgi:flagellar L-ring protein precursor FlgH